MGLIQQANLFFEQDTKLQTNKQKIGLLSKIKQCASYDVLLDSFRISLKDICCEKGAILYPSELHTIILLLNTGFDLTTIHRFCPKTNEFTRNFPEPRKWYVFNNKQLEKFQSMFSSHEFDSLTALYVYPIELENKSTFFILLADSLLNSNRAKINFSKAEKSIQTISEILESNLQTIKTLALSFSVNQSYNSMKTHTESALNSKRTATLLQISFEYLFPDTQKWLIDSDSQSIYYAIVHRIARQTGSSNILYIRKNFNVHIVLFTSLPVELDLYFHQLLKPLEKIFGINRISKIEATSLGTNSSLSTIMDFLTGET